MLKRGARPSGAFRTYVVVRFNLVHDPVADCVLRHFKIVVGLGVRPELRAHAEDCILARESATL